MKLFKEVENNFEPVKIYYVRLWVLESKRGGGFKSPPVEDNKKVIIGNLDFAMSVYREFKNKYDFLMQTGSNYRGFVEIFESYVWENGEISTHPEFSDVYIERISTENN